MPRLRWFVAAHVYVFPFGFVVDKVQIGQHLRSCITVICIEKFIDKQFQVIVQYAEVREGQKVVRKIGGIVPDPQTFRN